MIKLIALGVLTFVLTGLLIQSITTSLNPAPGSGSNSTSTADRYIAAHREGETIPANPLTDLPGNEGKMSLDECRAENLNPYADAPVTGTVVRIVDGDTLRISVEGFEMPVRLWGIDAPEQSQGSGPESTRNLERLVPEGSRVKVHPVNKDRYGRMVGVVDNGDGRAVNFQMVAQGWAYHHREYDPRTNGCLAEAEKSARDSRMGVWKHGANGGERPWERRRQETEA